MSKFKKYSEPREWFDDPEVFCWNPFREVYVLLYHWTYPPADFYVKRERSVWIRLRKCLTLELYW